MLFQSLSFCFELRSDDPEIGRRAAGLIGPFARPLDAGTPSVVYSIRGDDPYALHRGDQQVAASQSSAALLKHLLWLISGDTVELAEGYLLIHAGAVVDPDGDGLLILGESGSGKTTLVAALVQEGFGYLSDEAAAIDLTTGIAEPWPRPLGLAPGTRSLPRFSSLPLAGGEDGSESWAPAEQLRPGATAGPARVRQVVDHRFEAGAATRLEPLSRGTGLVLMGSAAPRLRHEGDRGLITLANVIRGAQVHSLVSGDLELAVRAVREL